MRFNNFIESLNILHSFFNQSLQLRKDMGNNSVETKEMEITNKVIKSLLNTYSNVKSRKIKKVIMNNFKN